jgi:arginine decarboxylase
MDSLIELYLNGIKTLFVKSYKTLTYNGFLLIQSLIYIIIIKFLEKWINMKISLTKGKSEGPTKLNAFDNALLDADIGNVNLIPVSSMLPPDAQEIPLPKLEPGEMTNCVLSHQYSDVPGDTISAVIAYAQAEEMGCVIETKGINKTKQELTDEAKFMAEYMIEKRQLEIINYKQIIQTHTVEEKASVVAALIYHNPRRH